MITVTKFAAALGVLTAALSGCGGAQPGPAAGSGRVVVVAAENTWGSIAAELGGGRAEVLSIISNPDVDPHAYEPTARDARAMAQAQLVILNGAGYDTWASRLADADPAPGRTVLVVADLAGRSAGDNPHMWYSPPVVHAVSVRISAVLSAVDRHDAAYFAQRRDAFLARSLAGYDSLRAEIRQRYAGVPVGATESIFVDMARDLDLDLVTPSGYMKAISEGDDPSAGDKSTADAQVTHRRIRVLVYNSQNATSDVQDLVTAATRSGIPVVAVTETLDPAGASFEAWQTAQLRALAAALARATGR